MTKDPLRSSWASLGVAFNVKWDFDANPEQTIIDTIKSGEFPEDRKIFELMLCWVFEYLEFIHVERLKGMVEALSPFDQAILGGVACKCLDKGDLRFKAIIQEVNKRLGKIPPTFSGGDDELYIKMKGLDSDFNKFGIRVAPVHADDHKKLRSREHTIKNNIWLKNRLLFGANLRSDFITIFTKGMAANAYQAAKILNCSHNASYRNWKNLNEARLLGLI